jgi:hypothetical protein
MFRDIQVAIGDRTFIMYSNKGTYPSSPPTPTAPHSEKEKWETKSMTA